MVRNMPEGPKPESLHDQLVCYLWNGERLRLRDIPELAPRWLEILTEMGGLPDTEQPRRPETGSKTDKTGTSVSPDVYTTRRQSPVRNLQHGYPNRGGARTDQT
jgi:hypothetical protein